MTCSSVANVWQEDRRPPSATNARQRVLAGQQHNANDDRRQPLSVRASLGTSESARLRSSDGVWWTAVRTESAGVRAGRTPGASGWVKRSQDPGDARVHTLAGWQIVRLSFAAAGLSR